MVSRLTITELIHTYSQCICTFLFATVFNLNEPESQLVAKLTLPHGKIIRVIFPMFWFTKFLLVLIHRALSVLDKEQMNGIVKLLSVIFFHNICIVTCGF